MGYREELEKQLEMAEKRLNQATEDTPQEILDHYRKDYDDLSFELNNLYDDPETQSE
ncbi:MAG: hypothetical protein LUD68_03555 [Rikenellaceae bacterium]|nr:hypothetical protein [Rikenellaceae bacterium]